MDRKREKAILEAVLFTMGESVEVERLAAVIEEDQKITRKLLMELKKDYERKECGVTLLERFSKARSNCSAAMIAGHPS